jgi:hypothetical protein
VLRFYEDLVKKVEPFNSLAEIRNANTGADSIRVTGYFQFSRRDSSEIVREAIERHVALSILSQRFRLHVFGLKLSALPTFNSLAEIPEEEGVE